MEGTEMTNEVVDAVDNSITNTQPGISMDWLTIATGAFAIGSALLSVVGTVLNLKNQQRTINQVGEQIGNRVCSEMSKMTSPSE